MPFDGDARGHELATSVIARLELLQEIAALKHRGRTEDDWATCLWGLARKNEALMNAGMKAFDQGRGQPPAGVDRAAEWFGLYGDKATVWGSAPISEKRELIAQQLKVLREEMSNAV